MRFRTLLPCCVMVTALTALPACASHVRRGPTSPKSHKVQGRGKAAQRAQTSSRPRAIDDARASEIQNALVKAGYLQTASGHWDDASADAMRKMQADNGWQTKLIPDSRALIKLGLGPGASGSDATTAASSNLVAPED